MSTFFVDEVVVSNRIVVDDFVPWGEDEDFFIFT